MNIKEVRPLSQWTRLVTRTVQLPGMDTPQAFHSLEQADYVCMLAMTKAEEFPMVRQYRPAIEAHTLELPGGLRDGDEDPKVAAIRELLEETGYECEGEVVELGCMLPDSGRLENRLWCYAALACRAPALAWRAERGVEPVLISKAALKNMLLTGEFSHALHIAAIGMAMTKGIFSW